jgi:hypothetical protein
LIRRQRSSDVAQSPAWAAASARARSSLRSPGESALATAINPTTPATKATQPQAGSPSR